jgi:glutamate synthase domain-containing protein 3
LRSRSAMSTGRRYAAEHCISKNYGARGLPDDTVPCACTGTCWQSFGAFARGP